MMDRITQEAASGSKSRVPASGIAADATELLTRAISLDPNNSEWPALMQGAQRLNCKRGPLPATSQPAFEGLRVAVDVAKMNLISSPEPLYPGDAKAKGVEGTVRFSVRIGADGHVKDVVLGNPYS